MKETITITIPSKLVSKIITDYVIEKYGAALDVESVDELLWNDYSLIIPSDGLEFSKK